MLRKTFFSISAERFMHQGNQIRAGFSVVINSFDFEKEEQNDKA
ncbi:MAG: hypothetical protein AB7S69_05355 [Salinivirgaceae bacterium]